ncbi:MAG TPA: MFS transporter [Gaiellaceae bacterium]
MASTDGLRASDAPTSGNASPRWGAFGYRDFRLLVVARGVSAIGNGLAPIALAFAVLDLTGSTTSLGIVVACRQVPQIVFLLLGGAAADRLARHTVMVGANVASAASQAIAAGLILSGTASVPALGVLAAVNGMSSAFFAPAASGIVPQLIPPEMLQRANALLRLTLNVTRVAALGAGGVIVGAFGSGDAVAIDAGSFAVAAAFLVRLRLPTQQMPGRRVLAELHEGWRAFSSLTWVWTIAAAFALINAAQAAAIDVLAPAQAKEHLGGATAFGVILMTSALGFVSGGALMLHLRPRRLLKAGMAAVLLTIPTMLALGPPLPLLAILPCAFIGGLGIEIFSVLWDTALQRHVPKDVLSRVSSWIMVGYLGLMPLGFLAISPIAHAIGVSATFYGAAAVTFAAVLATFLVRRVRELSQ